jgi:hypothetical protein
VTRKELLLDLSSVKLALPARHAITMGGIITLPVRLLEDSYDLLEIF